MVLFFILAACVFALNGAVAAPGAPIVTRNVHVVPHATPSQCPSSVESRSSPVGQTDLSRFGSGTVESPGILSCTGCAIDNASGDCVCSTCYDYFND